MGNELKFCLDSLIKKSTSELGFTLTLNLNYNNAIIRDCGVDATKFNIKYIGW